MAQADSGLADSLSLEGPTCRVIFSLQGAFIHLVPILEQSCGLGSLEMRKFPMRF